MRGTDSAGHSYQEFAMSDREQIRVTFIPHQDWAGGPTLRIQKRAFDGHTVPGPEFPAGKAGELIGAIEALLAPE